MGRTLVDESSSISLGTLTSTTAKTGDWISGTLTVEGSNASLTDIVVHAANRAETPDPELTEKLPTLKTRADLVHSARNWFRDQGFLEVETPIRVPCPGLEPHLRAFPSGDQYLITSPELHLKRLLAAGAEKIVEFSCAFRDEEHGPWHRAEFTMLEWYRAWSPLAAIENDCESLIETLAKEANATKLHGASLDGPFDRTTVRDQFLTRCGIDLADVRDRNPFAKIATEKGHTIATDDDWDAIFFRIWIRDIEPHLGTERPVFVHGYPASQAALARIDTTGDFPVALRFELYAGGIELANAFDELNDPVEQRRRHEKDRALHRSTAPPLDENFLGALESGMPPAAGIALGMDRLIALLCGVDDIGMVRAFRAYD
jgi:lysyl-tRNA synthetase class 2